MPKKPVEGQPTQYHRGDEVYHQAIITRVRTNNRVDVAYVDDGKQRWKREATWRDGAAYGPPPGGGTPDQ